MVIKGCQQKIILVKNQNKSNMPSEKTIYELNDIELLTLAAEAVDIVWSTIDHSGVWVIPPNDDSGKLTCWNPLTDDGAALRLAVKLQMPFSFDSIEANAGGYKYGASVVYSADTYADARRAIVLAAATLVYKKNPA